MLISVKKKFIFIASPKAASTTVGSLLKDYAEIDFSGEFHPEFKHMTYKDAIENLDFFFQKKSKKKIDEVFYEDYNFIESLSD